MRIAGDGPGLLTQSVGAWPNPQTEVATRRDDISDAAKTTNRSLRRDTHYERLGFDAHHKSVAVRDEISVNLS